MALADGNRVQHSYQVEDTWGVTKGSADFEEILVTSGSFSQDPTFIRSDQIRSDAQRAGSKRVGVNPTVNYNIEMQSQNFDDFIEHAIRSDATWNTGSVTGTTIAAVNSSSQFTDSGNGLGVFEAGQWVYVSGFTGDTSNNGWARVTTAAAGALTVDKTLVDDSAGESVTIESEWIQNGTAEPSFSLQEEFLNLTNRLHIITGARIGAWNFNVSPRAIITGSFAFQGKDFNQATSKAGSGTVNAAAAQEVMSEVDAIGSFFWGDGGAAETFSLNSFNFGTSTATRGQTGLGSEALIGLALGTMTVSGGLQVYLSDSGNDDTWTTLEADFLAGTKRRLAIAMSQESNSQTDHYLIEFPSAQLTSEPGDRPGLDNDVMSNYGFEAEPGTTTGSTQKTIQVFRVSNVA